MVAVLVILDGASEPLGAEPTSLERARTPVLDRLAAEGTLSRLQVLPPGLPFGSENAIPALLGWTPPAPVDRGALEAAARGIPVASGERAWRIDVLDGVGEWAGEEAARMAAAALASAAPGHAAHAVGGHRVLLVGPPPLPAAARGPGLPVADGAGPPSAGRGLRLRAWPEGIVPPRVLGPETVLVAAVGAAAGVGRLLGARVVIPEGATGLVDTDLTAKAAAALSALSAGAARVVVHVGGADEAGHRRDPDAKVAVIERADRELIAPIAEAVRAAGGTLRVCPDHGCDPATGLHDPTPVPCLDVWRVVPPIQVEVATHRLTERAVALAARPEAA